MIMVIINRNKIFLFLGFSMFLSCSDDGDLESIAYRPDSYNLELPAHFPAIPIPADNPLTQQGVELGRFLFYDPILSKDSTMSCASCHDPKLSFTDGKAVSFGVEGKPGTRSAMSLINIGFSQAGLFWDGRVRTLEQQALLPIEDPLELNNTWENVINKLKVHPKYPKMFREAFGIADKSEITKELAVKAIAQFERTLVSSNSKYDRVLAGKDRFDDLELIGFSIFFDTDPDLPDGECAHCHNAPLSTSDDFFNNGLQEAPSLLDFNDKGRGLVTKTVADNGLFKATTLRNLSFTAPYMHNGSLSTIDEVLAHYNTGGKESPNSNSLILPLKLDNFHLECLKAFLATLDDPSFNENPAYQNPFK